MNAVTIVSVSLKNRFCKFTWKTIALMHFHVLVLTLNHKSVFLRSDDVTRPHLLLRHFTLLLILIENIVLVVSQENVLFAIVSIEFKARKRVFEVPMTS